VMLVRRQQWSAIHKTNTITLSMKDSLTDIAMSMALLLDAEIESACAISGLRAVASATPSPRSRCAKEERTPIGQSSAGT
jgi:hypothetical protein